MEGVDARWCKSRCFFFLSLVFFTKTESEESKDCIGETFFLIFHSLCVGNLFLMIIADMSMSVYILFGALVWITECVTVLGFWALSIYHYRRYFYLSPTQPDYALKQVIPIYRLGSKNMQKLEKMGFSRSDSVNHFNEHVLQLQREFNEMKQFYSMSPENFREIDNKSSIAKIHCLFYSQRGLKK